MGLERKPLLASPRLYFNLNYCTTPHKFGKKKIGRPKVTKVIFQALTVPQLKATISQLQKEIKDAKAETGNIKELYNNHNEELKKHITENENRRIELLNDHDEKLNKLYLQHSKELENLRMLGKNKEEDMCSKHILHVTELMKKHEEEIRNKKEEHRVIIAELEARLENQETEVEEMWNEERGKLEKKIKELEIETKGLHENMLKDSDFRLQVIFSFHSYE